MGVDGHDVEVNEKKKYTDDDCNDDEINLHGNSHIIISDKMTTLNNIVSNLVLAFISYQGLLLLLSPEIRNRLYSTVAEGIP